MSRDVALVRLAPLVLVVIVSVILAMVHPVPSMSVALAAALLSAGAAIFFPSGFATITLLAMVAAYGFAMSGEAWTAKLAVSIPTALSLYAAQTLFSVGAALPRKAVVDRSVLVVAGVHVAVVAAVALPVMVIAEELAAASSLGWGGGRVLAVLATLAIALLPLLALHSRQFRDQQGVSASRR